MKSIPSLSAKALRYATLVVNVTIIILCMLVFFPLGSVSKFFDTQCALYSSLHVEFPNASTWDVRLILPTTTWGGDATCSYTTFIPVVVMCYTLIWTWSYLQMQTIYQERQVMCVVIINVLLYLTLFILVLVSSGVITVGLSRFCHGIHRNGATNLNSLSCTAANHFVWSNFHRKQHPIYTYLYMAQISSWLLSLSLLFQCIFFGYIAGTLVQDSIIQTEREQEYSDKKYVYDNGGHEYTSSFAGMSVQDETGSLVFTDDDMTMHKEYETL